MSPSAAQVARFRQQLGLVLYQGLETQRALDAQAGEASLRESTRTRLRALGRALAEQVGDIASVVAPALGGPLPPDDQVGFPRGALDYLCYLHRDWAWADGHDEEGQRSLAALRRTAGGRPLGRVLVLGAGACRLAYDVHAHLGATQTAVVDVDPFLLLIAEAVIRGARVELTETSVNALDVDPVSRRWTLAAPSGPLGDDAFRFFLADGTKPPFEDASFDTIVTPWFIDQVPTDLEGFLRTLHGLLVPGGRWLNHGPLIYPGNSLPIARWYARQEIFDLSESIGFHMAGWESASQPCLVSPLTGRGKIETVFTFEGRRDAGP
jgi:ubiquinone/menaquinone biosynthesis C-methylase UbiE